MTSSVRVRAARFAPNVTAEQSRHHSVRLGKRLLDIIAAAILILLLLPAMVATAIAVKLSSRGPILFRQHRVGRGGREFSMLKFRTMHADAEKRLAGDQGLFALYVASGHKLRCAVDPRVTRVGRILRKWSVDELPQLFNVLAGHMSLVGPRPVLRRELMQYEDHVGAYLELRPGLTGLWQVSGRSDVKFPERAELDAVYRARCSPWLDFTILARTPLAVLLRRGSD